MQLQWNQPRKGYWEGVLVAGVGLALLADARHWPELLMLLSLPGLLVLLASGTGLLLWPGDSRLPQFASWGAIMTAIWLPLLALSGEGVSALLGLLGLLACYLAAGRVSLYEFPRVSGAPAVPTHLRAAAHIGIDEFLLAWFKLLAKPPRDDVVPRIVQDVTAWEDWLSKKRLRSRLHRLHPEPPKLLKVESTDRQLFGREYRHIRFASEYLPDDDMPGAQRWQSYAANRTAHAWVLEHSGAARPWLLCIHGYRMGSPLLDLRLFSPQFFHDKLGLNLACMVLPLHGPRRKGLVSGEGYLEGDFLDFVHAERQAQWDLRRLLSWLRLVKHAPRIGVYGVSLGGYNTALLAGLDDELACAVAGIPVTDMAQTQWRHFPTPELAMLEQQGIDLARMQQAFAAVSPLTYTPLLPAKRLGIFAGAIDSLVWPDQPLHLHQHWDGSRLDWYEGSHLTFLGQDPVKRCIVETLRAGELIDTD